MKMKKLVSKAKFPRVIGKVKEGYMRVFFSLTLERRRIFLARWVNPPPSGKGDNSKSEL